ncbi:hypothetical protein BAUCODRAFT_203010 [Baudoinia panamericana UAMH 10762]|uniref:Uncharacterized protein n=1 Tax=Baudoinia panamericana (strain UAMH 10762) TaxID=717646 RepID=M2NNX2_BAUPA|nr:uncharacterized protein BAUCODRAFT_203010 [Baudoinia panamericana UAMH 10762]EMD01240.1 hypothetical protein BAUCODRAFT_203010 [Baudoinia panamericana UAMH 10762]
MKVCALDHRLPKMHQFAYTICPLSRFTNCSPRTHQYVAPTQQLRSTHKGGLDAVAKMGRDARTPFLLRGRERKEIHILRGFKGRSSICRCGRKFFGYVSGGVGGLGKGR